MRHSKRTVHIGDVLDGLIRKLDQGKRKKGSAVKKAWVTAINEETLKHTRPVSFKNGTIIVIVENSAWLYKLTLEKHLIIKKFNEEYTGRKKAKEIRFRIGSLEER